MPERSLFDLLDEEDARSNPQQCEHRQERRSVTVWPGEVKERLTMTCTLCERVRGRYPGE